MFYKTLAKNLAKRRVCSLKWTLVCNSWRNRTVSTQKPLQNMYKTVNIRYNLKGSQIKRESRLDKRWRILSICEALERPALLPQKASVESAQSLLTGDGINPQGTGTGTSRPYPYPTIHGIPFGQSSTKKKCREMVGEMWSFPVSLKYTILKVYYYKTINLKLLTPQKNWIARWPMP